MFYLRQHCSCDFTDSSFVLLMFQPGIDLHGYLEEKATDLMRRNCGQMQPHVIVLHTDHVDTVFAVVQSGLFYEVGSVIEAVDSCIKSCFVFGLKYPQPSRSSWTFIQKAGFGLSTQSD